MTRQSPTPTVGVIDASVTGDLDTLCVDVWVRFTG